MNGKVTRQWISDPHWPRVMRSRSGGRHRRVDRGTCGPGINAAIAKLSVQKILTHFIPETLSHSAMARRERTLFVPRAGKPVGQREEHAQRGNHAAHSGGEEPVQFLGTFIPRAAWCLK